MNSHIAIKWRNTVAANLQNYCQIGKRIFISEIIFKFYKIKFLHLKAWKDCTNPKFSFSNWKEVSVTKKQFFDEPVCITVCGTLTQEVYFQYFCHYGKSIILFCKLQVTLVLIAVFCHRCGSEFNDIVLFRAHCETQRRGLFNILPFAGYGWVKLLRIARCCS